MVPALRLLVDCIRGHAWKSFPRQSSWHGTLFVVLVPTDIHVSAGVRTFDGASADGSPCSVVWVARGLFRLDDGFLPSADVCRHHPRIASTMRQWAVLRTR